MSLSQAMTIACDQLQSRDRRIYLITCPSRRESHTDHTWNRLEPGIPRPARYFVYFQIYKEHFSHREKNPIQLTASTYLYSALGWNLQERRARKTTYRQINGTKRVGITACVSSTFRITENVIQDPCRVHKQCEGHHKSLSLQIIWTIIPL